MTHIDSQPPKQTSPYNKTADIWAKDVQQTKHLIAYVLYLKFSIIPKKSRATATETLKWGGSCVCSAILNVKRSA